MPGRKRLTLAQGAIRHAVRGALTRHTKPGQKLLLAVSGGADSLALASATAFEAGKLRLDISGAVIDHGLQPGSDKVALKTQKALTDLGIKDVIVKRVRVGTRGGPEAAARSARYEALEKIRIEVAADFIVLGHTQNDQAETILLGLVRGSGARSLSGMSEKTGNLLRPLLTIERSETIQFCKDEGLKFWSDPQNRDEKFLRVKMRLRVIPFLEKHLGPGISKNLIRSGDQLREDDQYLTRIAGMAFNKLANRSDKALTLDSRDLEKLEPAIRNRLIKTALDSFGVISSRNHVLAVADLVVNWHGQKKLSLPGVRVERKGTTLTIKSNQES